MNGELLEEEIRRKGEVKLYNNSTNFCETSNKFSVPKVKFVDDR